MRALLIQILPFFLPFVVYFIYRNIKKRMGVEFDKYPLAWLVVAGFVCVGLALGFIGFADRERAGSAYEPAYIENGKIVSGKFKWRD